MDRRHRRDGCPGRTLFAGESRLLGRFSIHTTRKRKRLLSIADRRPFEIKNLGAYERQRWQRESEND